MKTTQANLLNIIALIAMPVWAIISFEPTAEKANNYTALIPVAFAVLLLLCHNGLKKQSKVISHIAVLLTLIAIVAIYLKPFTAALNEDSSIRMIRNGIMILTGVLSMISFIKSFIEARRKS
jgi:hypothetical protein